MAKAKKTAAKAGDSKPIADVAHPGTTAPSDTSKSIITSRPMIKDPMVVEEDKPDKDKKPLAKKTDEIKITPPEEEKKTEDTKSPEPAESKAEPEPEEPIKPEEDDEKPDKADDKPAEDDAETDSDSDGEAKPDDDKPADKDKKSPKSEVNDKEAETAAQDAKLQQLVDSKKYFLPINAVEHRRSKRVVIGGVVLVLLLAVAWADIALDASLIQVSGVKPVTHFFSN